MQSAELSRKFLAKVSEYLVSLPFDLAILQEVVTQAELPRDVRELAAGVLLQALGPQEGPSPDRFVDDVLLVRRVLWQLSQQRGEIVESLSARFDEVFVQLADDVQTFQAAVGPALWKWLEDALQGVSKQALNGKRPAQYCDDESAANALYDEGLEFQTNYDVTDERVANRLRRAEQVLEILQRRQDDDSRKKS
jgi:hypothetical protein